MREILFRGKRIDNGEWVEGMLFYTQYSNPKSIGLKPCIQVIKDDIYYSSFEVIPETVGQFTGLIDKNGVKIFEGDILCKWETDYEEWEKTDYSGDEPMMCSKKDVATMERTPVYWLKNESFGYEGEGLENSFDWEVIGKIYDNPELLQP